MTVGFRADAETINGTADTSVVVSRPTGTTDGDVLVAFITGAGNMSISTPAGWTLIGTETTGTAVRVAAFWKEASSEPASWTWTLGSSVRNGGYVAAFTGVDTSDPITDSVSRQDATAGTTWLTNLANIRSQGLGVGFAALTRTASGTGTTHTTTDGTERADQTTNGGSGTDLSYTATTQVFSTAGGQFIAGFTSSQSCSNGAMWAVTLAPAFIPYDGGETGVIVEAAFGAYPDDPDPDTNWAWTDISDYVREADGVTITKGRQDEQSQIGPTTVRFVVNNDDGRFTPDHPTGAYWPNVLRGLPIRVSVPYGYGIPLERATAFVESYRLGWDVSLNAPTVEITALGRLSRVRAGDSIRSAMFRMISGIAGDMPAAVAYWPMEDGNTATRFAAERGGAPMPVTVSVSPGFDSTLVGSEPLPTITTNGRLVAAVDPYTSTGQWTAICAVRLDEAPASETVLLDAYTINAGAIDVWQLSLDPGTPDRLRLRVTTADGTEIVNGSVSVDEDEFYAGWVILEMTAVQDGSDIDWEIHYSAPNENGASGFGQTGTLASHNIGAVYRIGNTGGTLEGAAGHLALIVDTDFDPGDSSFVALTAFNGKRGERTYARFTRLLGEEGVHTDSRSVADTDLCPEMGPQPADTLDGLLREIEAAEQGVIHDGGKLGGLVFIDRAARYNRDVDLALDMDSGHIAPGWSPTKDTQRLRTRSTVSRVSGSSATYTAADTSEGILNDPLTLNLADDTRLYDFAAWRVHLGTAPGFRYPQVGVNLRRNPDLVEEWLSLVVGLSRVTATGLPAEHGPVDLDGFLEGYTETISNFAWDVELNLSPASPYTVGVWEDDTLGRVDTAGSQLASGIDSDDTSLSVSTTTGPVWITTATHGSQFPFDIKIGGEVMTVTAITSSTSPQTFTVTRSVNGVIKSHSSGAAVNLATPMIAAL